MQCVDDREIWGSEERFRDGECTGTASERIKVGFTVARERERESNF